MAEQNTRRHGPRGPHGGMAPGEKAKDFKGTMKKLMTYIGKYKFAVATVIVFAIGSTIFSIIGPKILSKEMCIRDSRGRFAILAGTSKSQT